MNALNPMLLKALAAPGSGEGVSPQEMLLSQLGEQDPNIAMLAQLLSTSSGDDDDDDDDNLDETNSLSDLARDYEEQSKTLEVYVEKCNHLSTITRQLYRKLQHIYAELEELRERNDLLAEALGACHVCWGEDHDCEVCRGEGYPGFFRPDSDMFRQYVTPAAQRLQRKGPVQPSPPPAESTTEC